MIDNRLYTEKELEGIPHYSTATPKKTSFYQVPKNIFGYFREVERIVGKKVRVPVSAYLIYAYFYTLRGNPLTKHTTPGLKTIGYELNVDKNTVMTSIKFLVKYKLLVIYKIDRKYKQGGKNIIFYAACPVEVARDRFLEVYPDI